MAEATTTAPKIEYDTTVFTLPDDSLGPNKATLLHARTTKTDGSFYKALLYVHGYSDYYFHDHVCEKFLEQGYDFFALDLRKCGRSIISPEQEQYRHYFTDIHEYDEEITLSIEHIIKQAKNKPKKLVFYGHSTGGLVACAYASSGAKHQDIDAVVLNSPYLAPLDTNLVESMLGNFLMRFGLSTDMPDNWYSRSIHSAHRGEWDFDIKMKTVDKIRLHGPSFRAIHQAQQELMARDSCIKCPILLLCSHQSIRPDRTWRDEYDHADLLLNVTKMRRVASTLSHQVTIYEVENARHDVFLSKSDIREKAFKLMLRWLKITEDDWLI